MKKIIMFILISGCFIGSYFLFFQNQGPSIQVVQQLMNNELNSENKTLDSYGSIVGLKNVSKHISVQSITVNSLTCHKHKDNENIFSCDIFVSNDNKETSKKIQQDFIKGQSGWKILDN